MTQNISHLKHMEKHHSCLNTRAVIEYFQENFPEELGRLVSGLGPEINALPDPVAFLTEPNNWVSSDVVIHIFENAKEISGDDQIIYKIGFESAARKKFSYIQRILLFAYRNPRRSLKRAQQINDKFAKNKKIELVETTRDSGVIRLHWFKDIPATKDFCVFNQGVYTGLPTVWNLPQAEVHETKCYFEGDEYCEYHCKWKIKPFFQTLADIFIPWRALRLSIEEMEQDKEKLRQKFDEVHVLNIQLQETNLELERKNIKLNENQALLEKTIAEVQYLNVQLQETNLKLEQKNLELRKNQELLRQKIQEVHNLNVQLQEKNVQLREKINKLECLQDIGTNILSVTKRDDLFQVTLRSLKNNARLNRVGIYLVDEKIRGLRFSHAVGVEDKNQLEKLKNNPIPFANLDNLMARVYNSGQAVIINDVQASTLNKNNALLTLLQPKTIIVAPLTSRGTVTGVLLADRTPEDGIFSESDKDFIVSFANQIAIALTNADLIDQKKKDADHLRKMFENAQVGILKIDQNNIILEANPRMKVLCRTDELIGRHIYHFLDSANQEKFDEIMERNRAGQASQEELEISSKNTRPVTVLMSSVPSFDENGQYTGSEAIISDISDNKRMQRQLIQSQKMEALGTMAGGFAHEFKNILQVIKFYTEEALQDLPNDSDTLNNLNRVLQSINKGTDIVHQILLFSRDQKPELKPMVLSAILNDGLKMVRAALPSSIIIQSDINPEAGYILGDSVRIHQVLLNLCTNAAHAMREKVGRLNVDLENIHLDKDTAAKWQNVSPGNYLLLTVKDNGIGMDDQTKERIFEPFFTTKEQGEGTGMGLSMVLGIVEEHGGSIEVESAPGQGTTFRIVFPRYVPARPEATVAAAIPLGKGAEMGEQAFYQMDLPTPAPATKDPDMPTGRERILFVDDELTLTEIVKKMLERLGYEVVAKSSSVEALEIFQAQPESFDLIIADQTMPHFTGMALAHEINRIRPELPIILCTGMMDSQKLDKKSAGIREILIKPVTIRKLAQVVRHTLDSQPLSLRTLDAKPVSLH